MVLFRDDAPALAAALLNHPTLQMGGGPNSPYLPWRPENMGLIDKAALSPGAWREDVLADSSPVSRLEFHLARRLAEAPSEETR